MAVRVGRRPERGPNWKRFVLCSPPSPGDGGQAGLYRYHLPEQKSYDLQPFPSPLCVTAQSTNRMLKECEDWVQGTGYREQGCWLLAFGQPRRTHHGGLAAHHAGLAARRKTGVKRQESKDRSQPATDFASHAEQTSV